MRYQNVEYISSKQLSTRISKSDTLIFSDFENLQHAVNTLFNTTFTNLTESCYEYILNYWYSNRKSNPSKIPYFKSYLQRVGNKFQICYFEEWLNLPRINAYNIEHVIARDCCTEEEAIKTIESLKATTSGTEENFIKRHGYCGKQKYKEFCEKSKHTEETFISKYGNKGKDKYIEYLNTKDSNSLSYFIHKYGKDEGKIRYELNCKQIGYYNTIEHYIEKYGHEKGFTKYKEVSFSKGKDSQYFINTYGEEYWKNLYAKKLEALGFPETYETLEGFKAYRKRVHNLSNQQKDLWTLPNYNKRVHLSKTEEAYNLDHKFSIYEAYRNNVPEHIVAHISNIEFISMKDNISKGTKCSITLKELYEGYYNYENKKDN